MPWKRAKKEKDDDTFVDRKGARQNEGKYEHESLLQASLVKLKEPGEERAEGKKIKSMKVMAGGGPL